MTPRNFFSSQPVHSCLFLLFLSMNGLVGGYFLKLVQFRALTGWDDEMAFDSLLFDWNLVHGIFLFLNGTALAGVFFSFFVGGFYKSYGWLLALVFLADLVYPWGLAAHYVRSFHFILLFGILINAYGFLVLAFLKRKLGLLGAVEEEGKADE
jgi:hypothetical protein